MVGGFLNVHKHYGCCSLIKGKVDSCSIKNLGGGGGLLVVFYLDFGLKTQFKIPTWAKFFGDDQIFGTKEKCS